jgi:hypothetical protein
MKSFKLITFLFCSFLLLQSCNKENRYSTKLMKGETWTVEHIKIDGQEFDYTGKWYIESGVDIYDSVPTLEWTVDGLDAFFEWQFQDKGKTLQLNYNQLCSEADGTLIDTLDYTGHDISGAYNVERHGRNRMEFTSSVTIGHPNKLVEISIERVKN